MTVLNAARRAAAGALVVGMGWPGAASAESFTVYTDPGARYEVVSVEDAGEDQKMIVTKRTDKAAAEIYDRRLLDCELRTYQLQNSGEELEDALKDPEPKTNEEGEVIEPPVHPIAAGAISEAIWKQGCAP